MYTILYNLLFIYEIKTNNILCKVLLSPKSLQISIQFLFNLNSSASILSERILGVP